MKNFAQIVGISLAFVINPMVASAAQTFNFSYTFQDNTVYSGFFDGTVDASDSNIVSDISNISLYRNNVNISLIAGLLLTNTNQLRDATPEAYQLFDFVNTTTPHFSFDGKNNAFVFGTASDPSNFSYIGTLFAAGPLPSSLGGIPQPQGNYVFGVYSPSEAGSPFTDSESFDRLAPGAAGLWSLTAVPEPESCALMLAGLGVLGVASWRRKQMMA